MAVCYSCGYIHYNPNECPNCGEEIRYSCHACGEEIIPAESEHCRRCGWFVCPTCGSCGCADDRPPSRQESGEGWTDDD